MGLLLKHMTESDDERLDHATVLELTGGRFDDALFESLAAAPEPGPAAALFDAKDAV